VSATQPRVATTSEEIVVTEVGGFPVSNIAYWKEAEFVTSGGARVYGTIVSFKSGGFIELREMTTEQFTSLVFGIPF